MLGFRRERAGTDPRIRPEGVIHEGRWGAAGHARSGKAADHPFMERPAGHAGRLAPAVRHGAGPPRVYVLNVQPAVTLAAIHVKTLPGFVMGGPLPRTRDGSA